VFAAFIKSKRHHKEGGGYMSYRGMAAEVGIACSTLQRWTKSDFPRLAYALSRAGLDEDKPRWEGGTGKPPPAQTIGKEHGDAALEALTKLTQHSAGVDDPETRWVLVQGLLEAAAALEAMGVRGPNTDF